MENDENGDRVSFVGADGETVTGRAVRVMVNGCLWDTMCREVFFRTIGRPVRGVGDIHRGSGAVAFYVIAKDEEEDK